MVLFKNRIRFSWVFDGFLERFGSLERMDMAGSSRIHPDLRPGTKACVEHWGHLRLRHRGPDHRGVRHAIHQNSPPFKDQVGKMAGYRDPGKEPMEKTR